jgi:hypothetical protein
MVKLILPHHIIGRYVVSVAVIFQLIYGSIFKVDNFYAHIYIQNLKSCNLNGFRNVANESKGSERAFVLEILHLSKYVI